jgi:hypothetical protein
MDGIDQAQNKGQKLVEATCECDDEPLVFIECKEVVKWLCNWQPLEKGSAPGI